MARNLLEAKSGRDKGFADNFVFAVTTSHAKKCKRQVKKVSLYLADFMFCDAQAHISPAEHSSCQKSMAKYAYAFKSEFLCYRKHKNLLQHEKFYEIGPWIEGASNLSMSSFHKCPRSPKK